MRNSISQTVLSIVFFIGLSISAGANAYETGDWILRLGPTVVAPDDDSGAVDGFAGSGVDAKSSDVALGFTLTYMMAPKWGVELLAATPFSHDIEGEGSLSGIDVGSLKHLPPTLSVLYFPAAPASKIQPYIGAGINYTYFFDTQSASELEAALSDSVDLDVDNTAGLSLRAGIDIELTDTIALNAGIWYIDIDTTATLKLSSGATADVDVDIDPFVYMLGVSYKF